MKGYMYINVPNTFVKLSIQYTLLEIRTQLLLRYFDREDHLFTVANLSRYLLDIYFVICVKELQRNPMTPYIEWEVLVYMICFHP